MTGIDKSAHERLLLLADFSIAPKGVFNASVSHAVFKTVPSTSVTRLTQITVNGTNLQANCLYADYSLNRAAAGELTWTTKGDLSDGNVPTWSLYPYLSVYGGWFMATTKVVLSGPLFDGQASEAAKNFTDRLALEIAEIGKTWIQVEAHGFDKSGRGGTGAAAEGVEGPTGGNGTYTILGGIRTGKYAWPWLEGTSKRNESTGFKGYKTWRRTRLRMRKQVTPWAQTQLEQYLAQMGGTEA